MHLSTVLLCSFAEVREGLLFVSSGGITRLWRTELPAPMRASLATVLEMDAREVELPHEVAVIVMDSDGQRLAEVRGAFQIEGSITDIGEMTVAPLAFDLHGVFLPKWGSYSIAVVIDDEHAGTFDFRCLPSGDTSRS